MRISVAMCTYNGAAHLPEQLASIVAQTRTVDELVVCDDGSKDPTVTLLEDFRTRAPFPVRVEANETNLGSTQNFAKAVSLCSGDVIVLSDQDDVWLPGKVGRLEEEFRRHAEALLVFSDARVVDDRLRPTGEYLWHTIPFTPAEQRLFQLGKGLSVLLRLNVVTGATAAFRSRLRIPALPFPQCWVHDGWLAAVAAAVGECRPVEEQLVLYRRHATQQIGADRLTFRMQLDSARRMDARYFRRQAECFQSFYERLQAYRTQLRHPEALDLLPEKVAHLEDCARMRSGSRLARIPRIARGLLRGRYQRFGLGLFGYQSIAADLLL